ncbi:hypothetical protein EMN47_03880 [Prolixibacteraceae bacterium JC049]|nr:hypothetical protein [Prolixibacteraceae bacterium JC049]
MKHLAFKLAVAIIAISLFSCGPTKKAKETTTETKVEQKAATSKVYTIPELLNVAEEKVGKEVRFIGTIQHVCVHSGKRAILVDETGKTSIRVEAKGKINGFNRDLAGTDLVITGKVKMKPLKAEVIDQLEAKAKAKQKIDEKGGEHCAAEMANYKKMRDWMKEHNKNYYAIYYIDGLDYETKE